MQITPDWVALGIIPAYAGSTVDSGLDSGDKLGSSPHTRGAPAVAADEKPGD